MCNLFYISKHTHSPATHTPTPILGSQTPQPLIPAPYTNNLYSNPLTPFSFTVPNTTCGSIIHIQHNTPEDGPKHIELFIIINKLLQEVGISRQL
jgi:hypothetical protein